MTSHRVFLSAGSNAKGQLGIGSYDDAHAFTKCRFAGCVPGRLPEYNTRIIDVACGANHTVVLLERVDGSRTLWGAGDGRKSQLGPRWEEDLAGSGPTGPTTIGIFRELILPGYDVSSVTQQSRAYRVARIAAAWETTYVVLSPCAGSGAEMESDVLLSFGSNDLGALGVGEGAEAGVGMGKLCEPRVVTLDHVFPPDSNRDSTRRTIRVRSLRAGPRHVVAELGLVVTSLDVHSKELSSTSHSRTALVGWGASRHGQLGQTSGLHYLARPTRVSLPIDVDADPVVSYALGNQHTVFLHASGRLSALGSNKQGQIPSLESRWRVYTLGCTWNGTYMQAVDGERDGHVFLSSGNNAQGQLGRSCGVEPTSTVDLPGGRLISTFVCGSEHVLVVMSGSSQEGDAVVGWGWNEHGNMGLGSLGNVTTPTQLWPREDSECPQKVVGIWAGCATSWLLVE